MVVVLMVLYLISGMASGAMCRHDEHTWRTDIQPKAAS